MTPLKVGDRVAVYTSAFGRTVHMVLMLENSLVYLGGNNGKIPEIAHVKQCRRLKPKAKRRRIWVDSKFTVWNAPRFDAPDMVEFIEVRKKGK